MGSLYMTKKYILVLLTCWVWDSWSFSMTTQINGVTHGEGYGHVLAVLLEQWESTGQSPCRGAARILILERSLKLIQHKNALWLCYPSQWTQKSEVMIKSKEGTKTVLPDIIYPAQDFKDFKTFDRGHFISGQSQWAIWLVRWAVKTCPPDAREDLLQMSVWSQTASRVWRYERKAYSLDAESAHVFIQDLPLTERTSSGSFAFCKGTDYLIHLSEPASHASHTLVLPCITLSLTAIFFCLPHGWTPLPCVLPPFSFCIVLFASCCPWRLLPSCSCILSLEAHWTT